MAKTPQQTNARKYSVPKNFPPKNGEKFNVPFFNEIEILAPAKSLLVSKIYGIGIGRAKLNQQIASLKLNNNENFKVPDGNPDLPYLPDAIPNITGGYDKTVRWDGYMSSSLLGMPVMCYLKFVGGEYVDYRGNVHTIPDIIFETVIITLTQDKQIKKTSIMGSDNGSVKENNGLGDWDIEIRAIITASSPLNKDIQKRNQTGSYPRENMEALWKVLRAPISIPIQCWFLNQFDINYITIEKGVQIQQVEGEYEMQRIVIPACSDKPLIITIAQ